jgi:DNA-binding NarL/FixJ family response regulator
VRVVIVDDDGLVRVGLRAILSIAPELEVVGEGADGADVPDLVSRTRPDVLLIDVRMPGIDGLQATRRLVASGAGRPRVLVMTTLENDEYVYQALRVGASGYLLKRATPVEIVQAVQTVAVGDSLIFPAAIRRLVGTFGRSDSAARTAVSRLTEREGAVLRLMAAGLTNAEIAGRLVLSVETVKTHVGNVLTKLRVRNRTQAVIVAYESGFVTPAG